MDLSEQKHTIPLYTPCLNGTAFMGMIRTSSSAPGPQWGGPGSYVREADHGRAMARVCARLLEIINTTESPIDALTRMRTIATEGVEASWPEGDPLAHIKALQLEIIWLCAANELDANRFIKAPAKEDHSRNELTSKLDRVQQALWFWLPEIPPLDPQIRDRILSDTLLLIGMSDDGNHETAESKGWITLRGVPLSEPVALTYVVGEHARLAKLSEEALVEECLKTEAADFPIVNEMMNRLSPGWEKKALE